MVKNAVRALIASPKLLSAMLRVLLSDDGNYQRKNVPYQCQFATPELTADILEERIDARDDPRWKEFGYKSKDDAAYWAHRQCGVCCVKMVLDFKGEHRTVAELTADALEFKGYDTTTDSGWYYKPLAQLLNTHGVKARVEPYMNVKMLCSRLLHGSFVIASVNPQIIRGDHDVTNYQKSGHLVLVTGFKKEEGKVTGLYIHNPSGKTVAMRENAFIPTQQFHQAYGKKGISVGIV